MGCKKTCSFEIFCSEVVGKTGFMMKKMRPKHTCGRVFNNTNASAKWVRKVTARRMVGNNKITISEIINNVRQDYQTGITYYRAWKTRNLAKEAVEGEAAKQYTMLWQYSEELRKANRGNTCKLQLFRPNLEMSPRFERFYMCLHYKKAGV